MAFAGRCGIDVCFDNIDPFAPIPCGYVLQIKSTKIIDSSALKGARIERLGTITTKPKLAWQCKADGQHDEIDLGELDNAWRKPLAW